MCFPNCWCKYLSLANPKDTYVASGGNSSISHRQNLLANIDISKLNHKLNLMSQMPNNNIGLAFIFRRFRSMEINQQKQFVSTICWRHINIVFKHLHGVQQTFLKRFRADFTVSLANLSREKLREDTMEGNYKTYSHSLQPT